MKKVSYNIFAVFILIIYSICETPKCLALEWFGEQTNAPGYVALNCFEYKTSRQISVTNGSIALFSDKGIVGDTIMCCSALNEIPNPLGITHSGLLFNKKPCDVVDIIIQLTGSQIKEKAGERMVSEIMKYFHNEEDLKTNQTEYIFIFEATGSAEEVLSGIPPHVHIRPFSKVIEEYSGNIYVRLFNTKITDAFSADFIKEHIGKPYERHIIELLRATRSGNMEERTDSLFCSELCGLFFRTVFNRLKDSGIANISNLDVLLRRYRNVSNIIPEQFCSLSGNCFDLLHGMASPEGKVKFIVSKKKRKK